MNNKIEDLKKKCKKMKSLTDGLCGAISFLSIESAKILIKAGADVNGIGSIDKDPAIFNVFLCEFFDLKSTELESKIINMLEYLIKVSANINIQDKDGNTLLICAIVSNSTPNIIKKIIELGADLSIRNFDNETAYDTAVLFEYSPEILNLLIQQ